MATPIALFVFNRPEHTQRTLEALAHNNGAEHSSLFVFSDGPRHANDTQKVGKVREICRQAIGFLSVEIVERTENFGLARNIIEGVGSLFERFEQIIVLEDDLTTSIGFLSFMNAALEQYRDQPIWSICGYCPPIHIAPHYPYSTFLAHRNGSWGWATWKDRWEKVDWEMADFQFHFTNKKWRTHFSGAGNDLPMMLLKQYTNKINSWSIRFCYTGFKEKKPTVYPTKSLIVNQGTDGSGTHMKRSCKYLVTPSQHIDIKSLCPSTIFDSQLQKSFKRFYDTSTYRKVINWLKTKRYLTSNQDFMKQPQG